MKYNMVNEEKWRVRVEKTLNLNLILKENRFTSSTNRYGAYVLL